jgi:hypothetical protein
VPRSQSAAVKSASRRQRPTGSRLRRAPAPQAARAKTRYDRQTSWRAVLSFTESELVICARPAIRAGRFGVAHDRHPRSSGCRVCWHRGWSAEPVAHPAARCGERDPQRIADDHQEQGGWRWQAHRHRASRPVTVTDNGRRRGSGAPVHPPHHVPVHWLPGHQDHRGQSDCQRPHGKGDGRLGDRPCTLHPASIGRRRLRGEKDGEQPPGALGRNSDQHDLAVCDQRPTTAASGHPPNRRSGRLPSLPSCREAPAPQ